MMRPSLGALALGLLLTATAAGVLAQAPAPVAPPVAPAAPPPAPLPEAPKIDPAALAILKAAADRLAAARTMRFTARTSYEHVAPNGQPLVDMTVSNVTLHRPNRPPVTAPPPTIDAMVEQADDTAAIHFPFVDLIAADPYKDITQGLVSAFVIGRAGAGAGTETDMLALATANVQAQVWIGAKDHLPRMIRAVCPKATGMPRYEVAFSDWKLGGAISDAAFTSAAAANGKHMPFARPDAEVPSK